MEKNKISIITVVKNGMPFLKETLDSIKNQTFSNWELLVIDANSIDGSLELIESYNDIIESISQLGYDCYLKQHPDKNNHLSSFDSIHIEENHPLMYGMCRKFRNTTFRDFKLFSPNRSLALSAFDITNGSLVYFSDQTTPDMKIATAVRISSSIPIIFEPVIYQGHLFVDGGVMRRLPIDAFPEIETDSSMLAFLLQTDYEKVTPETIEKMGLGSYARHVFRTMIKLTQDLDIVERAKRKGLNVVSFGKFRNISSVSAINFHLSETQKVGMYHSGYLAVREYLYFNRIVNTLHHDGNEMSCASPRCLDDGPDTKHCAWLDRMYAVALQRDIHQEEMKSSSIFHVSDPYIILNLILFLTLLASLSVIVIQTRNAFHAMLLSKYSGIRTFVSRFTLFIAHHSKNNNVVLL